MALFSNQYRGGDRIRVGCADDDERARVKAGFRPGLVHGPFSGGVHAGNLIDSIRGVVSNTGDIAATADQFSAIIKDLPTLYAQIKMNIDQIQKTIETVRNISIATAVGLGGLGLFFVVKAK